MTYTINQLQQMGDFEVNKALCIKLGYDVTGISEQRNMMTGAVIDYCNNPNDIMPLAFERGVYYYNGTAFTNIIDYIDDRTVFDEPKFFYPKNPLRAIACLLLMMED